MIKKKGRLNCITSYKRENRRLTNATLSTHNTGSTQESRRCSRRACAPSIGKTCHVCKV